MKGSLKIATVMFLIAAGCGKSDGEKAPVVTNPVARKAPAEHSSPKEGRGGARPPENLSEKGILANEASAIGALKMICSGEEQYRFGSGTYAYGPLSQLGAGEYPYIPNDLARGKQKGYSFALRLTPARDRFQAWANPLSPGQSGRRYFFIDESGVIRYRKERPASSQDSIVE